jgi:acetyl-CoA carboxylase biotin carboxyl carrier protein
LARKKSNNSVPSPDPAPANSSPVDVELLERLIRLMTANELNTVDLRDGKRRVVIKRGMSAVHALTTSPYAPPAVHPAGAGASAHSPAAADHEKGLIAIKSPMVGTFYESPSPDAPPFVSVGTEVNEDSDVCIIEAMKVFNNIKAECTGTIQKILVSNGQTVEFGQVLFLVKPS